MPKANTCIKFCCRFATNAYKITKINEFYLNLIIKSVDFKKRRCYYKYKAADGTAANFMYFPPIPHIFIL